jgi:hypothetical protein
MPIDLENGIILLQTPQSPKPRFSLGCTWSAVPVNIQCLDEEECLALGRHHEQLLRGMPIGSAVQTIMTILPSTQMPTWEAERAGLPESQMLAVQRQAIAEGLPHSAGTMKARLRAIPHLVTLRWPLASLDPELPTILKTLLSRPQSSSWACQAQLAGSLAHAHQYFLGLQDAMEGTLKGLGHDVTRLDVEALGYAVVKALDPMDMAACPPRLIPEHPLRGQVLAMPEAENIAGGWRFGYGLPSGEFVEQYRHQLLSLHQVPYRTYPGMLSAPRAPKESKPMALWDASERPVTVVVNAAVVEPAAEDSRLLQKSLLAGFQAKISKKNQTIKENVDKVLEDHMMSGSQTGWARIHLVAWSKPEEEQRVVEQVRRSLHHFRLAFAPEPTLGSTLALQALPLGFDPDWPPEWALNRARRFDSLEQLSHLLTLYGGPQGTKRHSIPYVNMCGEGIGFNPFDNPLNPHFNIIATSGGGKTFEVNRILNHIMPLGAIPVVLDPLHNYRAACEYHEGELIVLNANNPIFINPFYGPLDHAHVDALAAGLGEMAGGGTDRLSWTQFTVLGRALTYFAHHWDLPTRGEPILQDFVDEVLETGAFAPDNDEARLIAKDLSLKLSLFYGDGMYAGFVNGRNSFTLTKNLTVIEFGELNNQHLQGTLFFFIFNLVTQRFKNPALRRIWKCIFGDELWKLLKYQSTANVMEEVIRTYRNFRASACFLSQRAEDWNSPVGQVIKGIAESNLFLKQGSGELPLVKKLFDLSDAEEDLFQYVGKYDTFNSGFLRLVDKKGGIVRMIPNALDFLLAAQTPEMQERRDHLATLGDRPLWERIAEAVYV